MKSRCTQTQKDKNTGRGPGRPKADRLTMFARRGRFSPFLFALHRPLTRGLLTVLAIYIAGVISAGDVVSAPPKTKAKPKQKAPAVDRPQNKQKPSRGNNDSPRIEHEGNRKIDDGRHRNPPRELPRRHPPLPGPDPRPPIHPIIIPAPVIVEVWYYDPVDHGEVMIEYDYEAINLILGSVSAVVNGVFVTAGESNGFAATAGFIFGATNLHAAFSDHTRHPAVSFLVGTASIAMSVWNLSGGIQSTDAPIEYYYDTPVRTWNAMPQTAGFSFSF